MLLVVAKLALLAESTPLLGPVELAFDLLCLHLFRPSSCQDGFSAMEMVGQWHHLLSFSSLLGVLLFDACCVLDFRGWISDPRNNVVDALLPGVLAMIFRRARWLLWGSVLVKHHGL